jgi:hypothetical protein
VLEITFATFTPRITIHSAGELTVEVIADDDVEFSDSVEYEAVTIRDGLRERPTCCVSFSTGF